MQNLQVTFNQNEITNGTISVNLTGKLNSMNAYNFKNDLLNHLNENKNEVDCLIDLQDLESIDVIGLNALLMAHRGLQQTGKQLTIVSNQESPIDTVLHLTKFDRVLNIKRV